MSGCFILLFDHIDGKKKLMRVGSREEEEEELGIGQNVENQNVENQNVENHNVKNQNVENQNFENQNVKNYKERQKFLKPSVCRKFPFKWSELQKLKLIRIPKVYLWRTNAKTP